MKRKNHRQKLGFSVLLLFSLLINCLPTVRAQDVVTSDDFTAAFVFKSSRKAAQHKVAFSTPVRRTSTQQAETSKRIIRQAITVARVNPKRTKFKEVNPNTLKMNTVEFKRKSPQETSVIFAGVGEFYLREQDIDKALEFFREAVLLDAVNKNAKAGLSEALTRRADQLLTDGKLKQARTFYEEAIQFNPFNAAAHAGLGEISVADNETDKAVANYQKALELDSDLTELLAPLGVLYFQRGEIAAAENYLQRAVAASPDNAETQYFYGLLRYKQNRNDEAAAAFRRSIELDPKTPEVHYYLGEALDRLDRTDEAITAYQQAVQLKPNYLEAWFDLGVAYYNRERYQDAVSAYKEVVRLRANHGEARANLADVYRQLATMANEPKEIEKYLTLSLSEYRLAATFIKDDPEIFRKFGYVAGRIARYQGYESYWNLAIENLDKARALTLDYIDYTNLGWAYYNAAQFDRRMKREADYRAKVEQAKINLQKAVSLNDKMAAPHFNLGVALIDLGEYKAAVNALKNAVELQQNWVPALNELGIAYRKSNDLDNAAKQFRKAIEVDGNFGAARFNLAEAEIRRGNLKEARKEYEKLKQMGRVDLVKELEKINNGAITR